MRDHLAQANKDRGFKRFVPTRYINLSWLIFILLIDSAYAAPGGSMSSAFGGITDFLKTVVNTLIFEWGYYIGIGALAYQGYRWWAGHITMMEFFKWSVGIVFVFFSPNIVDAIRSNSAGSL